MSYKTAGKFHITESFLNAEYYESKEKWHVGKDIQKKRVNF